MSFSIVILFTKSFNCRAEIIENTMGASKIDKSIRRARLLCMKPLLSEVSISITTRNNINTPL